jgi:hypothetical protein
VQKRRPRCCEEVVVSNSARPWTGPAEILLNPTVRALLDGLPGRRVLELGAGCLRNSRYLLKRGMKVDVYDPYATDEHFSKQYRNFLKAGGSALRRQPPSSVYDIVVSTYVLETICSPDARSDFVDLVNESLKPNGSWLLSVRGPVNLVLGRRGTRRCSDGYITSQRTFVRSYTRAQLVSLLTDHGFRSRTFLHKPQSTRPELLHVIARRDPS